MGAFSRRTESVCIVSSPGEEVLTARGPQIHKHKVPYSQAQAACLVSERKGMSMTGAAGSRKFNVAHELMGESPSVRGNKVALYHRDELVTYKELAQNVTRFANILKEIGVLPTERVMIVLPDSPLFVYAFLGSIELGAWPVPINTMLQKDDYRFLLEDSHARVLVTTRESNAAGVETDSLLKKLFPDNGLASLMRSASTEADPYLFPPDDIGFWLYTSGANGRLKATPHRQKSLLLTADSYAKKVLQIREHDMCFSVSKLFVAYGLGNSLTFPMRFGASAVLLSESPSAEKVLETLEKYRPSVFFGVPTQYHAMLKKMEGKVLPSLRICASAGEALPVEVFRRWKATTGLDILDGIGSTESLHIFISNYPGDVREGTSGRLVPGYEARIVDDHDKEVAANEKGHLLARGESFAPGYWNRPAENIATMVEGGWFRTGDLYSQQDGYFTYQGRGDDMLKVGGLWVSPMEIEYALAEHEAVHECAVVGHDVEGLLKPFAHVVLNEAARPRAKEHLQRELLDFVAERLPKFKRLWGIRFADDLPKTATGKIQRYKLRQQK
jgi:benzoate-CoA ligase family protein